MIITTVAVWVYITCQFIWVSEPMEPLNKKGCWKCCGGISADTCVYLRDYDINECLSGNAR